MLNTSTVASQYLVEEVHENVIRTFDRRVVCGSSELCFVILRNLE